MRLFAFAFFASLFQFAYNQTNSFSPEWTFGVNGGANLSRMRFNSAHYIPQGLFAQPSIGFTVRYISEEHFGIIGELNYSLCGWTEKKDTLNSAHLNEYTRSLAYLEVPFLSHLYFNLGKRARLIINAGPQFRYNIGEKEKKKIINDEESNWAYYDSNYKVANKFDYGLKGAIGLEIRTGIGSFILSGNCYFGLADIFNNKRDDVFQASSNQIIGINLTYLIRASK